MTSNKAGCSTRSLPAARAKLAKLCAPMLACEQAASATKAISGWSTICSTAGAQAMLANSWGRKLRLGAARAMRGSSGCEQPRAAEAQALLARSWPLA